MAVGRVIISAPVITHKGTMVDVMRVVRYVPVSGAAGTLVAHFHPLPHNLLLTPTVQPGHWASNCPQSRGSNPAARTGTTGKANMECYKCKEVCFRTALRGREGCNVFGMIPSCTFVPFPPSAWTFCKRMPRSDVHWLCVCWTELEQRGKLKDSGHCTRKKCSTCCEEGARWVVQGYFDFARRTFFLLARPLIGRHDLGVCPTHRFVTTPRRTPKAAEVQRMWATG